MFRKRKPIETPVIAIDSLGFSNLLLQADSNTLCDLVDRLNQQYFLFEAKVPRRFVITTRNKVFGTKDFSTHRLNDLFLIFSEQYSEDLDLRYLITASLAYHQMLKHGFIPRGGLGYGLTIKDRTTLLGSGIVDAYQAAEKRKSSTKDICAIQLSPRFLSILKSTERRYRLICFYRNSFFIHPTFLTDPDIGEFTADTILQALKASGANKAKIDATEKFLFELEDYDAALSPNSESRKFIAAKSFTRN